MRKRRRRKDKGKALIPADPRRGKRGKSKKPSIYLATLMFYLNNSKCNISIVLLLMLQTRSPESGGEREKEEIQGSERGERGGEVGHQREGLPSPSQTVFQLS